MNGDEWGNHITISKAIVWYEGTFVFILKVNMGNVPKGFKVSKTIAYRRIRKGLHSALNRRLANLIGVGWNVN